jgi:hypothetical protein
VTGRSAAGLAGVLQPAVAAGVVTEAGAKLAFRHGLIRHQLYADWVPEWLASALPVLAYRMPQVTGQLLRGVIAALADSDPQWEPLQAGLVTVAFLLGQYDEVQQAGRRLLASGGDPDRAAEVTWLMAYSLLRTGHAGEAIDALKIAVTRPGVNEVWSGRLRALQALMLAMTRRMDEAAEVAGRALADAERTAPGRHGAGPRLVRRGRRPVPGHEGTVGDPQRRRPGPRLRHPFPPGPLRWTFSSRVGVADPDRGEDRRSGRRRPVQSGDRRRAVPVP